MTDKNWPTSLQPVIDLLNDRCDPFTAAGYDEHGMEFDELASTLATILQAFVYMEDPVQTALLVAGVMPNKEMAQHAFAVQTSRIRI